MGGGGGLDGREDGDDEGGGGGGWVEAVEVVAAVEVGRVGYSCWKSFRVVCHCRAGEGEGKDAELVDENGGGAVQRVAGRGRH